MASFENSVINPALLQMRDPDPHFDDLSDMTNPDHISISVEFAGDADQDLANQFGFPSPDPDFDFDLYNDQILNAMTNSNTDDFNLPLSNFGQMSMNTPPAVQEMLPTVEISDASQVASIPINNGSPQLDPLLFDFSSPPDYSSPPMSNPGTPASSAFLIPNNSGHSPTDVLHHSPVNHLQPLSPEVDDFLNTGFSPTDLEALSRSQSPNGLSWSGNTSPHTQSNYFSQPNNSQYTQHSPTTDEELRNSYLNSGPTRPEYSTTYASFPTQTVQNGWARSGPGPSSSLLAVPGRGHARRHSSSDIYYGNQYGPSRHQRNQLSLDLKGPEDIPLPHSADSSRLPSPFPDQDEDYGFADFLTPEPTNLRRARSLGDRGQSSGHRGRSITRNGPVRHSPYPSHSPSSRRSSISARSATHSPALSDDMPLPCASPPNAPGSPSGGYPQVVKETVTTAATEAAALGRRKSNKDQKMYVCGVCGKELTAKHNLQRHEKAHYGIKDFKCEWCDRALTTSADLKRHQKTCKANPELIGQPVALNIVQSDLTQHQGYNRNRSSSSPNIIPP
jgi:hypothetical protein